MSRIYDDFEEGRIKHLEMIQSVIARLGNNSFLVKGWALTIAGIFIGFGINSDKWGLAAASVVPTLTFWGLDAYFLSCERLFRRLHTKVQQKDAAIPPFYMDATRDEFIESLGADDDAGSWLKTLGRGTLWPLYAAILVAALVACVIVATTHEPQVVVPLRHATVTP